MLTNKFNWGCKTLRFLYGLQFKSHYRYGARKRTDLFAQREEFNRVDHSLKLTGQSDFLSIPKETSKSPINIKEFLANDALTEENVMNFDYLYRVPKVTSVKRQGSARIIERGRMRVNIPNVLKLKLGKSYDKILFFLRSRGDSITEIELHYCFVILSEIQQFSRLLSEETDVLFRILEAARTIEFMNYTCISELLAQAIHEEITHTAYLTQLTKSAFRVLKDTKRSMLTLDNVELTIKLLEYKKIRQLLDVPVFLDYLSDRLFSLAGDIATIVKFIKRTHKYSEFVSSRSYINLENFIQERTNIISIQDLIDILYVYSKGRVTDSFIFLNLHKRLQETHFRIEKVSLLDTVQNNITTDSKPLIKSPTILSEQQASVLIWAVSQFDKMKSDRDLWTLLEARYLQFLQSLRLQGQLIEKSSFAGTLRGFDSIEQGTVLLWSFPFQEVLRNENEVIKLDFDDQLVIFYNKLRFKLFDMEMFRGFMIYEKEAKLNYLTKLPFEKAIRVLFCYICGIDYSLEILALPVEEDQTRELDKAEEFRSQIELLSGFIRAQLAFYLTRDFVMKELSWKDIFKFFLVVGYGMHMGIVKLPKEVLKTWFIELKYKYDNLTDILPKAILNSFLWRFNSRIHIKKEVFENDFTSLLKNSLVVELIPIMETVYFTDYNDEYIWTVIQLQFTKFADALSPNDFLCSVAMLSFKKQGASEFWEFCAEHYAKVLQHCGDETSNTLLQKFISDRLGESRLNEILLEHKDTDPGFDLAKEIAERPNLFLSDVDDIVEHSYGSQVRSPLNSFYVALLQANI